ncbi:hypothetical protein N7988_28115 (plasmid) [Bacillus cereus]|uniref:hypothetical protein n=1 Tax=Bacillus cereus TaxID=1396 RepID=UPI0021CB0D5C|nr:hypothetical protein [Bacillus cereus]MCU7756896.1 hypothetical protein [Bacillus cereus]MDC7752536.1 hypothetical protein [Bacillus cereus]UXP17378.1 hypothetical protein N7988_28115 [Bacillus cereus]
MLNLDRKNFFTQTIQYLLLLILFNQFWGEEKWFANKLRDSLLMIGIYISFLLVGWFSFLFRPISISVVQNNALGSNIEFTLITQEGNRISSELQRTVKLDLEVTRKGSVWWRILLRLIKNKELLLEVEPTPRQLMLQAKDQFQNDEIIVDNQTGFKISLNKIINDLGSLQTGKNNVVITKTYPYYIANHTDISIPDNLSASVIPRFTVNGEGLKWLKFFIKLDIKEQKVRFFRR